MATRSKCNPDVDFPPLDPTSWKNVGYLPSFQQVIDAIRSLVSRQFSKNDACNEVATILINHWTVRNVYTITRKNVVDRLKKDIKEFDKLKKIVLRRPSKEHLNYTQFKSRSNHLYDIHTKSTDRKIKEGEQHNVTKTAAEENYLDSQRDWTLPNNDPRKILCFPGVMM